MKRDFNDERTHTSPARSELLAPALAVAVTVTAAPALALDEPTVPWPAETVTASSWQIYTEQGGTVMSDVPGQPDCSRGAVPSGDQDIVGAQFTPPRPSAYYAFDDVNEVIFYRIRVGGTPLNDPAVGDGSDRRPYKSGTWNLLVDVDSDGFKEFTVVLDGNSGGNSGDINPSGDDLKIYFNDQPSQCVLTEDVTEGVVSTPSDLVWHSTAATQSAAVPPEPTADGATWDYGRTRHVFHDAANQEWGEGWFVDFQFPMSALTDSYNGGLGGTRLVGPSTPVAFGYSTANSNSNPLQKDFASGFCYGPDCDLSFPFGDTAVLVEPPVSLDPGVGSATVTEELCPIRVTIQVEVIDTMTVVGDPPVVTDTIDRVVFESYFDVNGNMAEDDGSVWTMMPALGSSLNPDIAGDLAPDGVTASLNDWGLVWDIAALSDGQYLVRVTVIDDDMNATVRTIASYVIDRVATTCTTGLNPTWESYEDVGRTVRSDSFDNSPDRLVYLHGNFEPVTVHEIGYYLPTGLLLSTATSFSDVRGGMSHALFIDCATEPGTYHSVVYPEAVNPPPLYDPVHHAVFNPLVADDDFEVVDGCTPLLGLLRNDEATTLLDYLARRASIYAQAPNDPSLDALGPNMIAEPGEGALTIGNGSSDDDDMYSHDPVSPFLDPDGVVLLDDDRPAVVYQLDCVGCVLKAVKRFPDIELSWTP